MKRFLTSAALITVSCAAMPAQVFLNEIDFADGKQWIELYNDGASDVDLGSWSIYQATKTPNRFQDYWWPFPTGTKITSKGYLRINWAQAAPTTPPPANTLFTGTSPWLFLFGHGYEALDPAAGAIALCRTKINTEVSRAGIFADWWQWGGTNFRRGSIAIASNLWNANQTLAATPKDSSLMRLESEDKLPHPLNVFRFDASPTPLAANAANAVIDQFGYSCSWNHPNSKGTLLRVNGVPFHGNKDFSITTLNTRGPAFFERMAFILSITGQTKPALGCVHTLDPVIFTPVIPTTLNSTTFNLPLTDPAARGQQVYLQAISFGTGFFSISDRLRLRVSQ